MVLENIGMAWWILIAVLGVFGVLALKRRHGEKVFGFGKTGFGVFLLIAGGFVFLWQGAYLTGIGIGGQTLIVTDGGVQVPISGGACQPGQQIEDTTVTLSAINFFTASGTSGTHRYRVNGGPALTVADAGTFTASPGDSLDILWENASITGGYYSARDSVVVPCSGTKTFSKELYQNGTLTLRVFNEEGNLIDSADTTGALGGGENETLANGDLVTLNAELIGTFQRGHPYGGVIVAEYDQSSYDDVKVLIGGSNVETPTVYAITNAGNTTKSYSFPALLGSTESTGGKILGSIIIDADDTNNPGVMDEIQFTIYTNNYFINQDTGGSFDGPAVEDEDDARTYTHTTISYLNAD